MDVIADILLISGALGVAFYCFVLSRRLTRFTDLEKGVGGAVAVLSAQVDDLSKALERARKASTNSGAELRDLTARADAVSRKLELHLASLHDLPEPAPAAPEMPAAPGADSAPEPVDAAEPESEPAPEPQAEAAPAPATPAAAPLPAPARQAAPQVQSFFSLDQAAKEAV